MRYSEQILKKEKQRIDNLLDKIDSLQDQQVFMAMVDDITDALDNLTSLSRIVDRLNQEVKKRDAIIIQGHAEDEKSWKAHDRLVREKESILMTKRILEKDDL